MTVNCVVVVASLEGSLQTRGIGRARVHTRIGSYINWLSILS